MDNASLGLIHIYCGDGKGKSTAGIGLAIRALGHDIPVVFAQFSKKDTSGEIKILKNISGITVLHSRKNFGFYKNMSEADKIEARQFYTDLLEETLQTAVEKALAGGTLLILDEIISTIQNQLVDEEYLIDFMKNKPGNLEVVLTGRNPGDKLLSIADYVSEINKVKHPFDRGIRARRGIEK